MQGTVRYFSLTLSLIVLIAHTATGQVAFGGRPIGLIPHGAVLPLPPAVEMPAVDVATLVAEDEERNATGSKGPYRFGYNHTVDLSTAGHGVWYTLRNGTRVWRLAIVCPSALSINFRFDEFIVPEGGRVFVYNDAGAALGAFTAASNPGHTRLGVSQLPGERITIEYQEPASVMGQGRLHIDRVTHAYRDVFGYARELGDSGPCNINVICPEGDDWRDQIRSVAIITTGGSGFCSGVLLNNCEQDSTPYFLTANHCLSADVADWVFRFNWDSPTCDPTENGPIDQTVSGCQLLTENVGTDMAFLELNAIPPASYNVFYSGWDKSGNTPDSVCGIHHPSGDIKKISLSQSPILQDNVDLGTGAADCWQVTVWDAGTTEPGSSGSGLWNQHKLVIGQLYGGEADCSNSVNDYYGRLDLSWPLLEEWLGTCGDSLLGLGDAEPEPIHYDAAVTSIVGIPELLCGDSIVSPGITLKNNGDSVLTAITVLYGLVGGTVYQFNWTGVLQPLQTVNVTLPAIVVPAGANILEVTSNAPNGEVDEVIENDIWQYAFSVSNPQGNIAFILTLDDFGSDVTWELTTDLGVELYNGGPYPDNSSGMVDTTSWCLTNDCYVFTIYDAFADGICCTSGQGRYEILNADGAVLAESDGIYTDQNQNEFCVTVVGMEELDPGALSLFPNPTTGLLNLRFEGIRTIDAIQVVDAMGRPVLSTGRSNGSSSITLDLHHLAAGVYTVIVKHNGTPMVRRVVVQH